MLLHITHVYLMRFYISFNAVCFYACVLIFYLVTDFCIIHTNVFVFMLCLWIFDTLFISVVIFCIMYSAFNYIVLLILY